MHSISRHARHGVVIYLLFSFTFSLLLVDKCLPDIAGAITALTFRKLKQITIKESLEQENMRSIARFPCDGMALVIYCCTLFIGLCSVVPLIKQEAKLSLG